MSEISTIYALLRREAGFVIDMFNGILRVRRLENGTFEVSSEDPLGGDHRADRREAFDDPLAAARRFVQLRREREVGFDFEGEMATVPSRILTLEALDKLASVELTFTAANDDVQLRAVVETTTASAEFDGIWILGTVWSSFVSSMRRLDEVRTGDSSLEGMSPGDLNLRIRALDTSGHLEIQIAAQESRYDGRTRRPTRIETSFEFDPSLLSPFVQGLNL
jgi:hypothetical protein